MVFEKTFDPVGGQRNNFLLFFFHRQQKCRLAGALEEVEMERSWDSRLWWVWL